MSKETERLMEDLKSVDTFEGLTDWAQRMYKASDGFDKTFYNGYMVALEDVRKRGLQKVD